MGASVATVNNATEIRLLAERQMGEFLKTMPKNEGGNPKLTGSRPEPVEPTLADIGITKKQSHVAQQLAPLLWGRSAPMPPETNKPARHEWLAGRRASCLGSPCLTNYGKSD